MPNLSTFSLNFKKIIAAVAFALLILVLLILIFLQFYNRGKSSQIVPLPPPPQIPTNPSQGEPSQIDLSQVKSTVTPKKLPIYNSQQLISSDDDYQKIAGAFGISQAPFLIEETLDGKQFNWKQEDVYLTLSETRLRYENKAAPNLQSPAPTENELLKSVSTFLNNLPFVDKNLALDSEKTAYLNVKGDRYVSADSFANAKYLLLRYNKDLSGYPLYFGPPSTPFLEIRARNDGTITYLETRLFRAFTPGDTFKIKELETAFKELVNGQGQVVQTVIPDENNQALELFRIQPFNPKYFKVTKVSLAYFLERDTARAIQPIFVFDGDFTNDANQAGKATIYLPAITAQ